jgi:hypothetical protein
MAAFFTRERFGRPQLYASLLLLAFAAQCSWVIVKSPLRASEIQRVERGLEQWRHAKVVPDPESPFIALMSSVGIAPIFGTANLNTAMFALFARLPFLFVGMLRGASLWYVTRRLYGNAGGYVALVLYCSSPPMTESGAFVNGYGPAAWGFFGAIFSAIALSHTVYALAQSPSDQVIGFRRWRWRRIVLLGVAFGIAIGAQAASVIAIPLSLGFMLYLAPGRRTACIAIVTAATLIGAGVVLATSFFDPQALNRMIAKSALVSLDPVATLHVNSLQHTVLILLFVISMITYLVWRRARYFGNTAPLLVLALLCCVSLLLPFPLAFYQHVLTFAFVFIAGIMADLLESPHRKLVLWGLIMLVLIYGSWGLHETIELASPPTLK